MRPIEIGFAKREIDNSRSGTPVLSSGVTIRNYGLSYSRDLFQRSVASNHPSPG